MARRVVAAVSHLSPTARPRLARWLTAALVAVALSVAGCAANFGAETNKLYQPAQGITMRHSAVWTIDTLVVANSHGQGTLVVAMFNTNNKPDALTGVSAHDSAGKPITVTPSSPHIALPPQQSVQFAKTGKIRMEGPAVKPGNLITVRFTFQNAAPATFVIPVVADTKEFASVPVGSSTIRHPSS